MFVVYLLNEAEAGVFIVVFAIYKPVMKLPVIWIYEYTADSK